MNPGSAKMAENADTRIEGRTAKRRRRLLRRNAPGSTSAPSTVDTVEASSKTFEASSVEDALMAAAQEFGPGVEVVDAQRRRKGGVFGFFARQVFEVTAMAGTATSPVDTVGARPTYLPSDTTPASSFDAVLAAMADGVVDTVEMVNEAAEAAAEPVAEPAPQLPRRLRPRPPMQHSRPPASTSRSALADRALGLIDLREGRRIPVDPLDNGTGVRERPSQLRRRLTADGTESVSTNPLTREVSRAVLDLRDSKPDWSIERLRRLGLGDPLLGLVEAFEPSSDLEWVQALATAIQVQMPASVSAHDTLLAGDGRASAVGLVQALAVGKIPAFLLIDGQQIPATADELALSIRECLR